MLLTFKGAGCDNCPFSVINWYAGEMPGEDECAISKFNAEIEELIPNKKKKPEGCPFRKHSGSIEISAEESK